MYWSLLIVIGLVMLVSLRTKTPPASGGAFYHSTSKTGLLVYAEFFAPAREYLVRVFRERFECAREFLVLLRILDRIGTGLPAIVSLAQRDRAGCRGVDVPVRTAAGGVDHVAVAEILEEAGQTQRVHTAGDDRRGRLHAIPFLMVERAGAGIALDHVGDDA